MFSDYLKEVLLFRQGPFISEDATSIFELPGFARETDVQDWDVFLRFCLVPGDYIFKKRYRQDFLDSLETHLKMMYSMKPVFDSDEFNKKIFVRQELALRTVRNTLAEADFDLCHNPFALSWASVEQDGRWCEYQAWRLFIERLGHCLTKACAIRTGEHGTTDEAAANELAGLLVDVFYINHHVYSPAHEGAV